MALSLGSLVSFIHFLTYQQTQIPGRCFDTPMVVVGNVDSFVETRRGLGDTPYLSFDFTILLSSLPECVPARKVRAFASVDYDNPALSVGDRVTANTRLRPIGSLWNRGGIPTNTIALARGTAANASLTDIQSTDSGSNILASLRLRLSDAIKANVDGVEAERLLQGLLLGRQDALTTDDWSFLRELGIVHVLVVSGVHVSLVVLWAQWLLALPRRLFIVSNDAGSGCKSLMALAIVSGGYVLLTGASLPSLRALLMTALALTMRAFFWRVSALSSVVFSAAILISLNPWSALTSGFWLSVLLTGVIIGMSERPSRSRWTGWLRLNFVLNIASSVLTIFFFHQFSIAAFLTNLLVAPLFTGVVLPAGLFGLLMTEVSGDVGGWILSRLGAIVSELMHIMNAAISASGFTLLNFVFIHKGIFLVVGATLLACQLRARIALPTSLIFVALLSSSSRLNGVTEMLVADVGQGTMVIINNGAYTMLYDTGGVGGGGEAIAEREVIPWLKSRGINTIDLLVVSHGDLDHSGGLDAVYEHFDIRRHWGFGGVPCVSGRKLRLPGSLSVSVMMGTGQKLSNTNADSCVLLVEAHGKRVLLTGDMTAAAELELIVSGSLPRDIDILIAAHHGSATSSTQTFVDRVNPRHTVFTTKRANRFNHPHISVLTRFKTTDSTIWDTAMHGALTFKLASGEDLSLQVMRTVHSPYWTQFR